MHAKADQAVSHKTFILQREFSAHVNTTTPLTFLSALCLALSRIVNNDGLIIACEAAPEYLPESWHSITALSANIVPLAFKISKHTRVSDFVNAVINLPASGDPQQSGFFSIDLLNGVSDHARGEIFDLVYSYHGPGKHRTHKPIHFTSLQVDVHGRSGDENDYEISFAFNVAKFTSTHIDKIYELWLSILAKHLETNTAMKDLCLISPDEQHLVTALFNKTESEYPRNKCMSDLLWDQARDRPDDVAVTCGGKRVTYSELAKSSLEVAACLKRIGVRPDDPVGIFEEPSVELMTGIWGILASGGAYLPLSPEYPQERLKYMIADSNTRLIITQDNIKERLSELAPSTVRIITPSDIIEASKPTDVVSYTTSPLAPGNLAYVIYTSGSTGKPKGVMIEHHSIVNQMYWLASAFRLNSQKRILQKTPMSFDAAQWELLSPACGSTVVMGSPGLYRCPDKMVETIFEHNVTTLQCVPTLLQALLDTDKFKNCNSLVEIFVGGEALPARLIVECYKQLPTCRVINLYGPTECTINTSAFVTHPQSIVDGRETVSIGSPINNTQYYILDKFEAAVAVGETGELYIGGEGVARGYLHHSDLTEERFIPNPFGQGTENGKLYRTGDLASWNEDGTVQFCGRADNQVKLRGFRIELDEIKSVIETHDWVKSSAVILKTDPSTECQNLIAFIELDSTEAALMDQGNHDAHHQSKESKAQVLMQLSNKGCRSQADLSRRKAVSLPGKAPTEKQRREVFARKTYRFFEGAKVTKEDLLQLLEKRENAAHCRKIEELGYSEFGAILRYFGQYISAERLLPKYGYASPGALYPTQIYLEISGVGDLQAGYYYYYPVKHRLFLIKEKIQAASTEIKLHFIGKRNAIEPIYKHNIQEVMEIETGHIIGLFENILLEYGLSVEEYGYVPLIKSYLDIDEADIYLGSFQIVSGQPQRMDNLLDVYVQAHPGRIAGLSAGLYRHEEGNLVKVSDEIIQKRHVIAINQEVFERSAFGITAISRTDKPWMAYVNLGRKLQELQMNDKNFGFMSSGYSSKTGYDLPSAKRIRSILNNEDTGPSHFFVGGRINDDQKRSEGMKEDAVHMRGPAEMIKEDLANVLPDYMVPNRVVVMDRMPLTANGKIDTKELEKRNEELIQNEYVAPRTELERTISEIWERKIRRKNISINDSFFQLGGNSLLAVSLINQMNEELNVSLPLQVLFEASTIERLAIKIESEAIQTAVRLIPLQGEGLGRPIYCWPGLGGYCSNLRLLAKKAGSDRPFYGVQTHGINKNETPYLTIQEMAAQDVRLIRETQPEGPYTLWGYSFGARVAFEAAYQLEQSGDVVDNLVLIAPGSPKIQIAAEASNSNEAVYRNEVYVAILFSVFMGSVTDGALGECVRAANDEEGFVEFIISKNNELRPDLVKRIIDVVALTYGFRYSLSDLRERRLGTPITVIKARGDDLAFIENSKDCSTSVIDVEADHYGVLKESGVDELMKAIEQSCSGKVEGDRRPEFRSSRAASAS
jgi:amino acid adenylation domain-containing protein